MTSKQMPIRIQKYLKKTIYIPPCRIPKPTNQLHIGSEPRNGNLVYDKILYIVSNITGGGSLTYLKDLTLICNNYFNTDVVIISNKTDLLKYENKIKSNDIISLQQVLQPTDITQSDIIVFLNKLPKTCCVFTTIHENYYLNDYNQCLSDILLHAPQTFPISPQKFIYERVNHIICPSNYTLEYFQNFFFHSSILHVPHPDKICFPPLFIPSIIDNIINIGIITSMTRYKGLEYFLQLFNMNHKKNVRFHTYSEYLGIHTNVVLHKPYHEHEICTQLRKDNIHGLIFFNKWPETYSYALTKAINSGLPLYYTPIGAIHERLSSLKDPRFHPHDISDYFSRFSVFLDYIDKNQATSTSYEDDKILNIIIPKFYKEIFSNDNYKIKHVHDNIKPFCIYFPQFHVVPENNFNYYDNFTDMIALNSCNESDLIHPLVDILGEYNIVENTDIIIRQIEIAQNYGIYGFAIYYYWFSINTLTNNHTIFHKAIKRFFDDYIQFPVFFIWANESWSNNPAFTTKDTQILIKNTYTEDNFLQNMENLLPFFQHQNYFKIDNKPLFFIHHPHEFSKNELHLFYELSDKFLKKHGFDGIVLSTNAIFGEDTCFPQYFHHPNYKFSGEFKLNNYIDYSKYKEYVLHNKQEQDPNIILSIFPYFNNIPRLYLRSDYQNIYTKTINYKDELLHDFFRIQFERYQQRDKNELSKIFLMNAWNEWGEQMCFEPSKENNSKLLQIFYTNLITKFCP